MFWPEFDWDDANVGHIARHGVETWEAEEALTDPSGMERDAYGEAEAVIGRTVDGRMLVVFYVSRGKRLRVITVRDAGAREQRSYRRRSR